MEIQKKNSMKYILIISLFFLPKIAFSQIEITGLKKKYKTSISKISFKVVNNSDSIQRYIIALEYFDSAWHETLNDINNFSQEKSVIIKKLNKHEIKELIFYAQRFRYFKPILTRRYRFRIDFWDKSKEEFTYSIFSSDFIFFK